MIQKIFLEIISQDNMFSTSIFNLCFAKISALLHEHSPYHKLSKKEIALKAKPLINNYSIFDERA